MKKESALLLLDGLRKLYENLQDYKCIEDNYDDILGKPMDLIIDGIVSDFGFDPKEDYPFILVCNYIFGYTTEEEENELYELLFE